MNIFNLNNDKLSLDVTEIAEKAQKWAADVRKMKSIEDADKDANAPHRMVTKSYFNKPNVSQSSFRNPSATNFISASQAGSHKNVTKTSKGFRIDERKEMPLEGTVKKYNRSENRIVPKSSFIESRFDTEEREMDSRKELKRSSRWDTDPRKIRHRSRSKEKQEETGSSSCWKFDSSIGKWIQNDVVSDVTLEKSSQSSSVDNVLIPMQPIIPGQMPVSSVLAPMLTTPLPVSSIPGPCQVSVFSTFNQLCYFPLISDPGAQPNTSFSLTSDNQKIVSKKSIALPGAESQNICHPSTKDLTDMPSDFKLTDRERLKSRNLSPSSFESMTPPGELLDDEEGEAEMDWHSLSSDDQSPAGWKDPEWDDINSPKKIPDKAVAKVKPQTFDQTPKSESLILVRCDKETRHEIINNSKSISKSRTVSCERISVSNPVDMFDFESDIFDNQILRKTKHYPEVPSKQKEISPSRLNLSENGSIPLNRHPEDILSRESSKPKQSVSNISSKYTVCYPEGPSNSRDSSSSVGKVEETKPSVPIQKENSEWVDRSITRIKTIKSRQIMDRHDGILEVRTSSIPVQRISNFRSTEIMESSEENSVWGKDSPPMKKVCTNDSTDLMQRPKERSVWKRCSPPTQIPPKNNSEKLMYYPEDHSTWKESSQDMENLSQSSSRQIVNYSGDSLPLQQTFYERSSDWRQNLPLSQVDSQRETSLSPVQRILRTNSSQVMYFRTGSSERREIQPSSDCPLERRDSPAPMQRNATDNFEQFTNHPAERSEWRISPPSAQRLSNTNYSKVIHHPERPLDWRDQPYTEKESEWRESPQMQNISRRESREMANFTEGCPPWRKSLQMQGSSRSVTRQVVDNRDDPTDWKGNSPTIEELPSRKVNFQVSGAPWVKRDVNLRDKPPSPSRERIHEFGSEEQLSRTIYDGPNRISSVDKYLELRNNSPLREHERPDYEFPPGEHFRDEYYQGSESPELLNEVRNVRSSSQSREELCKGRERNPFPGYEDHESVNISYRSRSPGRYSFPSDRQPEYSERSDFNEEEDRIFPAGSSYRDLSSRERSPFSYKRASDCSRYLKVGEENYRGQEKPRCEDPNIESHFNEYDYIDDFSGATDSTNLVGYHGKMTELSDFEVRVRGTRGGSGNAEWGRTGSKVFRGDGVECGGRGSKRGGRGSERGGRGSERGGRGSERGGRGGERGGRGGERGGRGGERGERGGRGQRSGRGR